jgi:hypothetical protein
MSEPPNLFAHRPVSLVRDPGVNVFIRACLCGEKYETGRAGWRWISGRLAALINTAQKIGAPTSASFRLPAMHPFVAQARGSAHTPRLPAMQPFVAQARGSAHAPRLPAVHSFVAPVRGSVHAPRLPPDNATPAEAAAWLEAYMHEAALEVAAKESPMKPIKEVDLLTFPSVRTVFPTVRACLLTLH